MEKNITLQLEDELFNGNLLDIGMSNTGIIYNLYKEFNVNPTIEYIDGKYDENKIEEKYYDNCVLLFTLSQVYFESSRKELIKNINKYLKEKGKIYIWDVNKGYNKLVNFNIKIISSKTKEKKITFKDSKIFLSSNKKATLKILSEYFNIIEEMQDEDIYYIKAEKK
ncbi:MULTISPECIES: hypothetical protein [unclassified Clostridium]|uniref:hypothetical protein n=1 Tax=unclassified Clostridium TaxID=2614128 RepID=UPI00052B759B|nr:MULTISPECIES: hypothetical protein [unclassified Clostridium]KGK87531.1 hypothetical protein DP68_09535 [Clostridium sp. HMP27]